MIKTLQITNFKGFKEHTIDFPDFCVVAGHNNAGKSSAFEAIRIISTVAKKFQTHRFQSVPSWINDFGVGIAPSLDEVKLKPETIFYNYSEPPAIIRAKFENGAEVCVYLGANQQVYATAKDQRGRDVTGKAEAKKCKFTPIFILPQISPLQESETVLRKAYVEKCIDTQLSSRHFRNQIRFMHEHFEDFSELLQCTWDGVRVSEFDDPKAMYEDELFLMMREEGFVAEISNFGHGLQMWAQIVWFLARTNAESIVVLDEPDVYMHPQQQNKMIGLLRGRFRQVILSTHAPGILNNCREPEILRLHRKIPKSSCSLDLHQYNKLLETAVKKSRKANFSDVDEVSLKATVFELGSLNVTDSNGKMLIDIPARNRKRKSETVIEDGEMDFGTTKALLVPASAELHFSLSNKDEVSISIDGQSIDLDQYSSNGAKQISFSVMPRAVLCE